MDWKRVGNLLNIEYLLLIIGLAFIICSLIISYSFYPWLFSYTHGNEISILTTNIQILSTIFAIIISLTILGIQYLSKDLSPGLLMLLIKSHFVVGLICSYIISISISIFVISFPMIFDPADFIFYSFFMVIWCIIYMVAYLFYTVKNIQPINVLNDVKRNLPSDYNFVVSRYNDRQFDLPDDNDKFIDLEQVLIMLCCITIFLFG